MKAIKLSIFILLSIAASSCAIFKGGGSSKDKVLQYSFEAGQEFTVDVNATSVINMEQMGQSIDVNSESSSSMDFKVTGGNEDGGTNLDFSFNSMTQTAESPMGGGETDFSPILGKTFSFELSPTGQTNAFEGFEDIPDIVNAMGEKVSTDNFQQNIEQLFIKVPGAAAKKGDTWTEDISQEMPYLDGSLKITGQTVYTITGETESQGFPCFVIEAVGNLTTAGEFYQQGTEIILTRNGKSTSRILFAYTKGMMLSMDASGKTDGTVELPAMNMTMPQTITTKANFEVTFK